jgi:hypothetical protein
VSYVLAAVVVGIASGYLFGGRLSGLAEARLRWWPALVVGGVLQVASLFVDGTLGVGALLASFGCIITFTAMNLTRAGMGIVLVGVALNAIVIGANGGMPVRESAIVASGLADEHEIDELDFNSKWHLETTDDRFTVLGDIIPVPGVGEVLSFGDLVMAVGVADVIAQLMRGARPRRPEEAASTGDD